MRRRLEKQENIENDNNQLTSALSPLGLLSLEEREFPLNSCSKPCPIAELDGLQDEVVSADPEFASDVHAGLSKDSKSLPCKYFYDRRGSKLFDLICELEEYYLTRTESAITREHAPSMGEYLGKGAVVVEYGAGSSIKTRHLLDHLEAPRAYLPVDISETHLLETASQLRSEYPHVHVEPVIADFTSQFELPDRFAGNATNVYFPGSTIGNFEREHAIELLHQIAAHCRPGGGLLIGFDRDKHPETLERAYDDAQGVTAEFNLNLLVRMNRELEADFDLEQFAHVAYYNQEETRVEIFIESLADQTVRVDDVEYEFSMGERVHTEYSHKYTIEQMVAMTSEAGFELEQIWTDSEELFSIGYFRVD